MLFIFSLIALATLLINPWLLARNLLPRADFTTTLATAGASLVALAITGTVLLHCSHIPITAASLTVVHGASALTLALIMRLRSISIRPPPPLPSRLFIGMILLFAVLVIPFTPLAGRDTYKFQDLATVVQVDQSIPWLIHPSSLFGYTPRSYASAQPLLLATIAVLSHAGVDWSFYILSLLCGLTAIAATFILGRHLFPNHPPSALWLTFFYIFSPVFLRYNYWAIGRGLFMTLLPLFVLGLLRANRLSGILTALVIAPLLALSHKTGPVAITTLPLIFLASLVSFRIPIIGENRRWRFILPASLLLLSLAAGFLIVDQSPLLSAIRITTRLAFLFPLAIAGLLLPPLARRLSPAQHAMTLAALVTLPFVFTEYMYGSLIASLFLACLATFGLTALTPHFTIVGQYRLHRTTITLTVLTALTIIGNQAADSPSRDVVRAAQFIEKRDPLGPFQVVAPGLTRPRMQAYLSGCPRFSATVTPQSTLKIQPPPVLTGNLRRDAQHVADYLRNGLRLSDASSDWYGKGNKVYYVTVGGQGERPANTKLLFTSGNVSVYE
jgi:hypothetical protein